MIKAINVNVEIVETRIGNSSYLERRDTLVFKLEDLAKRIGVSPSLLLESVMEAKNQKVAHEV